MNPRRLWWIRRTNLAGCAVAALLYAGQGNVGWAVFFAFAAGTNASLVLGWGRNQETPPWVGPITRREDRCN